ncbi:MAG TPA: hypothetical protein DIS79_06390 [Bacteroidetes bacterium]|nr:hypothetical protein [Bacteroidota bacterium]HRK04093.1 hypothetical protein [Chlorobiota bacterium]
MGYSLVGNAKKVFGVGTGKSLLWGVLGAATYLAVPTFAKVNGTPGALTGLGSGIVLAVLTGKPEVAVGAAITTAVHATYIYLNPKLFAKTGTTIFAWSEDSYTAAPTTATAVPDGGGVNDAVPVQLPSGRQVLAYPGDQMNDIPRIGAGRTEQLQELLVTGPQRETVRIAL